MVNYLAFRLASVLVPLMPLGLGYRLASSVGDLAYWLRSRARANVLANLRRAVAADASEERIAALGRQVFRNGAKNYFDLLRVPRLRLPDLESRVRLQGMEHFESAVAQGRGVVLVSAHLGCFEAVAQVLAARAYRVVVPVEPVKPRRLLDFVSALRSSHGLRFVPAERGVIRMLVKALRQGEIVGLAVDRDVQGDGVPLEFYGGVTTFQTGAAVLARRLRCPVVAAFSLRREDNSYEVFVEPPLEMVATSDEQADIITNTTTIVRLLERYISRYPDQWVVFEPVWPATGRLDVKTTR